MTLILHATTVQAVKVIRKKCRGKQQSAIQKSKYLQNKLVDVKSVRTKDLIHESTHVLKSQSSNMTDDSLVANSFIPRGMSVLKPRKQIPSLNSQAFQQSYDFESKEIFPSNQNAINEGVYQEKESVFKNRRGIRIGEANELAQEIGVVPKRKAKKNRYL
ncbi:hypothetical protein FGO68_gene11484 [Halteria grandinella]|uniref:Uncharacterized protein n=1 Tax=Halteria grandinella TaxID=5974 RepID=A0A8J8P722_HALGN|nr:hypothetical protein FGO68_gene11484 [Halteria grandinella]